MGDRDRGTQIRTERGAASASLQKLVETAPVGMVETDPAGTVRFVNERWREITGYRGELPIPFEALEDLIHPDDRARTNALYVEAGESLAEFNSEIRLQRPDGSIRHVRVQGAPIIGPAGTREGFAGILLDITDLVLATGARAEIEQRQRDLIDALHDAVLIHNTTGIESANRAARSLFGDGLDELRDPGTFAALRPFDREGNEIRPEERATVRALRERRPVLNQVAGITLPDGTKRWLNINAVPRILDGLVVGAVTTFSDITESTVTTDALEESESRFRALAESLPLGVFHVDAESRLRYVNPRWCEIIRLTETEAIGSTVNHLVHPDDRTRLRHVVERSIDRLVPFQVQYRLTTPTNEIRWINAHAAPTTDTETGDFTGFIGSIEDVTPMVAAQEEMARLAGVVESTTDLIGIMNVEDDRLVYLNQAARQLFGFVNRDVTELDHRILYQADALEVFEREVDPAVARGESWTGELPMHAADGRTIQVWQTITAKRREDGTPYQLSSMGRDVTERRRLEAALAHQATHDSLTALPNRVLLLDHLGMALARAARGGHLVALLFLDLDRFKVVNDTLGHDAGDELLAQVARRITDVLRPADTVARLGGDEFVILAEEITDEHHALAFARRVAEAIEADTFPLGETDLMVTASVGIALSPGGPEAHPEALLRDADAAMYRAKDLGRARLELFDEPMRRRAAERIAMAEQLAEGIEHSQIEVHYQPSIDLATGRVTGVEALARWRHPERGMLPPKDFIALAEETGLIAGLGLRVLSDACEQGRRWQDLLGTGCPRVHVNLSARQLTTSNLPGLVGGVLATSGLHPDRLCLEITESVLMDDAPTVIDMLRALKDLGVSIAIDDFGTGFSSLSYLRRFPVDVLKVDQSFIDGLGPDLEDSAIVAAIVTLASTLDLEAVAEGVESVEQLKLLRRLGCRGAQGFLFARPAPGAQITPLLSRRFEVEGRTT